MFHTLNNHMIMVMICFCFFIINRIYRLCFLSAHNQLQCEHIVYKHCYTLRFSVYALTISIVIDNEIRGWLSLKSSNSVWLKWSKNRKSKYIRWWLRDTWKHWLLQPTIWASFQHTHRLKIHTHTFTALIKTITPAAHSNCGNKFVRDY